VVVDRCGGETLQEKLITLSDDVPFTDGGGPVVTIGGVDDGAQALEVEGDHRGHLRRADAVDGKGEVDRNSDG
jgi:hypothetical protein